MSTSIIAAYAAIQARAAAQLSSYTVRWPDDPTPLPDSPATFVYFEIIAERGSTIEIGGGRGANRHRKPAELVAYVFVPIGTGLAYALSLAEPVAAAFRSYRGGGVTFESVDVMPLGEGADLVPPGLSTVAGNYSCAMVAGPFYFDQIA